MNKNIKKLLILLLILTVSLLYGCNQEVAEEIEENPAESEDIGQVENIEEENPKPQVEENEEEEDEDEEVETSENEDKETEEIEEDKTNETISIPVYYIKDNGTDTYIVREVHEIPKTESLAKASLEELISGEIQTEGASRQLPSNTEILGINISDGKCIVDFSEEVLDMNVGASGEAMAIQAIVNTLTEYSSIDQVEFWVENSKEKANDWWGHVGLDGMELTRQMSMVWEPEIWIEEPKEGQAIGDKLRVKGSMIVFESTGGYRLEDENGKVLAEGTIQGEDNEGVRSFFDFTIEIGDVETDQGNLYMYGFSGKDSSETGTVSVDIKFD